MIREGIPAGAGDSLDNRHPVGGGSEAAAGTVVSGVNIRKIQKGKKSEIS